MCVGRGWEPGLGAGRAWIRRVLRPRHLHLSPFARHPGLQPFHVDLAVAALLFLYVLCHCPLICGWAGMALTFAFAFHPRLTYLSPPSPSFRFLLPLT